ncbi:DUF1672 family protein [Metabacillus iocasae]|uniref:DUF1672 family protein n=1 Tax=Priestia iocasae TaxID=2291674 RepID=A0ABS2QSA1_9BACI|nr:DUF1672 family protein [Metabacillus iocasae]MBM7702328.1 hypothetical protein [Metabacillus iocasae]
MKINSKTVLFSLGISLLLGGCSGINQGDDKGKKTQAASSEDTMASVQDYTGQGYALPYGKETDKIANENLDQIEKAAIKLFKENYKTDVTVHNVVGAQGGATVFVESKGEPHFYTYAVVPIDEKEKKVKGDEIWVDEFQVENAIKGGLYHMIFQEEFKTLDDYLQSVVEEGQVTGKTEEALQNVGGHGFMTPYYFVALTSKEEAIKPVYELYVSKPNRSVEDLRNAYEEGSFNPEHLKVNVQLFMADKEAKPSEEIFNQVTKELEEMNSIPRGTYSFSLNDNFVDKQSSEGAKDNSLKRGFPDYIIKK